MGVELFPMNLLMAKSYFCPSITVHFHPSIHQERISSTTLALPFCLITNGAKLHVKTIFVIPFLLTRYFTKILNKLRERTVCLCLQKVRKSTSLIVNYCYVRTLTLSTSLNFVIASFMLNFLWRIFLGWWDTRVSSDGNENLHSGPSSDQK